MHAREHARARASTYTRTREHRPARKHSYIIYLHAHTSEYGLHNVCFLEIVKYTISYPTSGDTATARYTLYPPD